MNNGLPYDDLCQNSVIFSACKRGAKGVDSTFKGYSLRRPPIPL